MYSFLFTIFVSVVFSSVLNNSMDDGILVLILIFNKRLIANKSVN